ncbi:MULTISPECIES: hypothetical protein [Vibrio]|uniref:hypothetical protein n=1 Tax=Vibrio TaxID=662 RepID=UPI001E64FC2E|nr:hypothetical protein [Vibrio lentus]MCC4837962.1 hypothetical protein [Vibrio lentus]
MMKSMNKQKGLMGFFPVIGLAILIMGLMGTQLLITADIRKVNQYEDTINKKIETIIKSAWMYHLDNVANVTDPTLIGRWPANIAALYNVNYLQSCNAGATCIPVDVTPWGSNITLTRFTPQDTSTPSNPINLPAKIRISLNTSGSMPTGSGDIGFANEIASLYPAGAVVGTTVTFEVARPGVEIAHDALMPRNGSRGPTANWDFEGFEISRMGDITFDGYTDISGNPVSLRDSVFDIIGLYGHGQYVSHPRCPSGSVPRIYLAMSQLVGKNAQAVKLGAFQTYALNESSNRRWRVQIRYYTQNSSGTGYWEYPRSTEAKALTLTRCETT